MEYIQVHPRSIFWKYLFGRRFEDLEFLEHFLYNFCLPASPRIFEHLKNGLIAHFQRTSPVKGRLEFSGTFLLAEIFGKVSFDPYNFRITKRSARKSKQIKNF